MRTNTANTALALEKERLPEGSRRQLPMMVGTFGFPSRSELGTSKQRRACPLISVPLGLSEKISETASKLGNSRSPGTVAPPSTPAFSAHLRWSPRVRAS